MAPPFFLTSPDEPTSGGILLLGPPPFSRRHGRLYRLVGYVTRRRRIFVRWDLMECDPNG